MTNVATSVHDGTMTDTTQPTTDAPATPTPDTTASIHDDETQRLRAELAAAERRLAEEGEKVAQYEAADRARAGTDLVAVGDTPDMNTWTYFRQCAHELALATVIPSGLKAGNDTERTAANVLTVILYGHGVGLAPIAAMQLINIIEGKPSISGPGMAALITGRGHSLEFDDVYDDEDKIERVTCTGRRRDTGASITLSFSVKDAVAAGLCKVNRELPNGVEARGKENKKKPWELYTTDMMRWRALSRVGRMLFGDVLAGIGYTPEELRPDVIDVEATEVPPAQQMQGEPMSAEQRDEMNRRVQAMPAEQRREFFAELGRRFEAGELPPKHLLGADHYLTIVSILDEIAPAAAPEESAEPARDSEAGATTTEASTTDEPADAVIVVTERGENDTPAPKWCIGVAPVDGSPCIITTTFTDDDVEAGQTVEISGAAWIVRMVCPFDERPM